MKRNCISVILLSITSELFSQSHNDYMGGSAVSGATDYYFQWIIIIAIVVLIAFILLRLLRVYYKQKDKEREIINEFHRAQKENWRTKDELSPMNGVVSSNHILTVYSDEPIVIKKYKNGDVNIALPHLIIIVDEFAELKAEQPEFMKELISAARIGRSLGVHLILATQKPSGQVNEQIWSNSRFKLCLKVQSQEDSN